MSRSATIDGWRTIEVRDTPHVQTIFGNPIRALFRTAHDRTGNLPAFPGIFPDQLAPMVRNSVDGERELVMARWGMPGPPQFGGQPVTNIRNVASAHWHGWLSVRNRCLVPATSFCEYADTKPARPRHGSR
jgi:putative SOS response-associated peptidase YedK